MPFCYKYTCFPHCFLVYVFSFFEKRSTRRGRGNTSNHSTVGKEGGKGSAFFWLVWRTDNKGQWKFFLYQRKFSLQQVSEERDTTRRPGISFLLLLLDPPPRFIFFVPLFGIRERYFFSVLFAQGRHQEKGKMKGKEGFCEPEVRRLEVCCCVFSRGSLETWLVRVGGGKKGGFDSLYSSSAFSEGGGGRKNPLLKFEGEKGRFGEGKIWYVYLASIEKSPLLSTAPPPTPPTPAHIEKAFVRSLFFFGSPSIAVRFAVPLPNNVILGLFHLSLLEEPESDPMPVLQVAGHLVQQVKEFSGGNLME